MKRFNNSAVVRRARSFIVPLLGTLLLAASVSADTKPPRNINLRDGTIKNMGFIDAGDAGLAFTNENIRHMAVSIGQLGGVNPETGKIIANEGNLLPLVAQELDITGSGYFYTNVYIAGDTFVYGAFYGSGAGITNIPADNIQGSLIVRPEVRDALETKLDADGVWEAIHGLQQSVNTLNQATPRWDTAYQWGNHAAAGYATSEDINVHCGATNNPHQVQAEQTGALPLSGGTLSGHIDMGGAARITNLPDPANTQDAVSKGYLDQRLQYIPPQGDIEMGIYTNAP